MAALFGQSGDGRREPKSLVEFRAGKMRKSGTTVTADTRKGLIYLKMEDTLLHFCWKDRQSGEVIDDFIVFPGDAEMKLVPKCSTGRVLLLKFRDSTSRRFFYWMQEPKEDKDETLITKVNELIENPPDPSQAAEGGHGLPPGFLGVPASQLQSLLGIGGGRGGSRVLDHHQLLELLNSGALGGIGGGSMTPFQGGSSGSTSGSRPASTPAVAPAPSTATPQAPVRQPPPSRQLQLGDLQNILSTMNIPEQEQAAQENQVSLTEVVTPEVLRPLSGNSEVQQQISTHLPPSEDSTTAVLTSPQFQQALGVFGSALQSGQLGPLMSQFGLGEEVAQAASTGDVSGFAEALQSELRGEAGQSEELAQESGSGEKEPEEKKDPPDTEERSPDSN